MLPMTQITVDPILLVGVDGGRRENGGGRTLQGRIALLWCRYLCLRVSDKLKAILSQGLIAEEKAPKPVL